MPADAKEENEEERPSTPVQSSAPHTEAPRTPRTPRTPRRSDSASQSTESQDGEQSEEDGEEEEPNFKYTRLSGTIGGVYRSGDATSAFLLSGDKMVIGTHNGNVNVLSLPSLQALRVYHVHSASITSVSVSPRIPTGPGLQQEAFNKLVTSQDAATSSPAPNRSVGGAAPSTSSPRTPQRQQQQPVPVTPSNSIWIATASMDGNVSVASLVDPKDYVMRNFARPINAVALSPEYKGDRSYLSGGLAGNLILTAGGKRGTSSNANTTGAAAAASGWLSSIGLAADNGKDTILHSGEGAINNIKYSISGKFVVWVNEHGIKLMRSNIRLGSEESEYAWRRIAHVDRPNQKKWEDMAAVWKARCEWIDEANLKSDEDDKPPTNGHEKEPPVKSDAASIRTMATTTTSTLRPHLPHRQKQSTEKLVVGWGDTIWVLEVKSQIPGIGRDGASRPIGSASILHQLFFDDCIISGASLYTPSLLLVLAYRTHDDDNNLIAPPPPQTTTQKGTPKRGVAHRETGLQPELRLINAATREEIDVDTLTMSRFERLSAADYHLSTMYVPPATATGTVSRGALDLLGDVWDTSLNATLNATRLAADASLNATRLFSSAASVRSGNGSGDGSAVAPSAIPPALARSASSARRESSAHPEASAPGVKIYLHSPFDCVLAVKRDLSDHLSWLLERDRFEDAWHLMDEHPEIASSTPRAASIFSSDEASSTPAAHTETLAEFFTDSKRKGSQTDTSNTVKGLESSIAVKEKRRIGELWLRQLVAAKDWVRAGQVAGKVLGNSPRWEHWVWTFAQAGRFDEITPYIPVDQVEPPLPSLVYEVVLGHYTVRSPLRLKELLDQWGPDLFDVQSVISAIENRLTAGDITDSSEEDGIRGRDWRLLQDCLARLYLADARPKEALRCYIKLQDADAAMDLIRDNHLLPAISDDIPGFLLLRISRDQMDNATLSELEEHSAENVRLLVDEGYQGTIQPRLVVSQLQRKGDAYKPFIFFYLRALWRGQGSDAPKADEYVNSTRRKKQEHMEAEGHALVDEFADFAVDLFADYDRAFLMTFLRSSRAYNLEKASATCQQRQFYPELVYLLSQTGETKRALDLIINRLGDVSMAIQFCTEQDDRDLWDDLLDYSMDKPRFIKALLEQVGTAIDPITLVRRIPEGLEIEGLRDGIGRMVREYEIQMSISEGVARVLRSEVASGMDALRRGRAKAVRFEVMHERRKGGLDKVEVFVEKVAPAKDAADVSAIARAAEAEAEEDKVKEVKPGHCAGCSKLFIENERDTLIGFACGHVFHLACLLEQNGDDSAAAAAAERLESALAADAAATTGTYDDLYYTRPSVGAKVAHAHIIRNALTSGCGICRFDIKDEDGQ